MPENYLKHSLLFVALVLSLSLALSIVPEFHLGSWKFKKVNLLADIRKDPPVKKDLAKKEVNPTKALKPLPVPKPAFSCPAGITCLEDYSENKLSLSKFFRALRQTQQQHVRIAFFGDSFIEGDILCGSFRDTLQRVFGGNGVGYVPITSEVAQYRTTIQHAFSNWKTYSIVGAKNAAAPVGTAGYCFIPLEGNEVEYKPSRKSPKTKFSTIRLFFRNAAEGALAYSVNDTLEFVKELHTSDSLQQLIIPERNVSAIKLRLTKFDSLRFYGASFETPTGIFVDNFSMRGNSGMGLFQVTAKAHREFNRFRDYKLILLQYGLNVVSETDSAGYSWYIDRMVRVIDQLKEGFPGTPIVLISVSDRSSNQDGKFLTMPNILLMRDAQRQIAIRCRIAFWDMFTAMGGENSMLKFVGATPPLAAKDYTHLTWRGGKTLAKKLADAILYERKRYEGKK